MSAVWPDEDARALVRAFAATPRALVALDFDGTLSPLVDDPMSARATPEAARLIAALAALPDTTVALVSGRSLRDLRVIAEHHDDSPLLLAGSHGAEFWNPGTGLVEAHDDEADHRLRDDLRGAAERAVDGLAGVWIEEKTYGFGVPTRLASPDDERTARERVDALVHERAPHWRRRTGHNIVEYSFRMEGKDTAVATLRAQTGATAVLFAGDDVTDEDALRSLGEGDLGVRVGPGDTAATVRVPDISSFVELLGAVLSDRPRTAGT